MWATSIFRSRRSACLTLAAASRLLMAQAETPQDLSKLDIEDLMKVEVTTASKSAQSISDVPSAIYVIRSEDIRRSGATCIPEALRLAPGVNVSQIDANKWMVSIRGFNNRFADKLLVLIDGQSIYTPAFNGVYWDAHMLPLTEVDRIEVIRGPGGSLWGANAVNGVVNIITKKTSQTQGGLANGEAGSERTEGGLRYGGKLGQGTYRVYADSFDQNPLELPGDTRGPDRFKNLSTGFKFESGGELGDKFLVKADVQSEHLGSQYFRPEPTAPYSSPVSARFGVSGIDAVGRWERNEASGHSQSLQVSFEDYNRSEAPDAAEYRNTLDFDYQTRLAPIGKNTISLGAGYQQSSDSVLNTGIVTFSPSSYTERVYSAFIHDSIQLAPQWRLLGGTKFINDPYTHWEFQPNIQVLYTPDENRTFWYSASRAISTPSRADVAASFFNTANPGTPPVLPVYMGNPNFISESVIANEIGSRFRTRDGSFVDITAFLDEYDHLRTFEPGTPYFNGTYAILPLTFGNGMKGETAGVETAIRHRLKPWWNVDASYALFSERLRTSPTDALAPYTDDGRGGAARHQFQIHSYMDLPRHFEFDTDAYYVSPLLNGGADGYWKLDLQLGWSPNKDLEFSVGLRNALGPNLTQAGESTFETVAMVPRAFYIRASQKF